MTKPLETVTVSSGFVLFVRKPTLIRLKQRVGSFIAVGEQQMGWSKTTTQTVFILEHHEGFFFFDRNKEGVVIDFLRFCHEDMNITDEKAVRTMLKMTHSLRIQIALDSQRWLPSFQVARTTLLLRRKTRVIVKPLVVMTDTSKSLHGYPGLSEIKSHPDYAHFESLSPVAQNSTQPPACSSTAQHSQP